MNARAIRKNRIVGALIAAFAAGPALADNWNMFLTVDNGFDLYFGTLASTNFYAGGGNNWGVEYNFTATGRPPTDYVYVATSSDQSAAQGFIGTFRNTTIGSRIDTGNASSPMWEVFPAGKYAAALGNPNPWPTLTAPTQTQVDAAIAYANANSLWVAPSTAAGYDNDPTTPTSPYFYPWGYHANITKSADWIWYDSGRDTAGFMPTPLQGFNHDEFLVFRVAGTPEPATICGLAVAGMLLSRKRRAKA